jgi:hypothetical protein
MRLLLYDSNTSLRRGPCLVAGRARGVGYNFRGVLLGLRFDISDRMLRAGLRERPRCLLVDDDVVGRRLDEEGVGVSLAPGEATAASYRASFLVRESVMLLLA